MPIAKGVNKKVAYKKETTWGVLAGAASAQYLRRVTAEFNLEKQTYESNEIRTDYQVADFRHGIRSAKGTVNGELSPTSYGDFISSLLAKAWTAGATAASLTLTIAASSSLYTVTRSAGSWLSDGFEVGNIINLAGASLDANTVSNNLLIVGLTATVATVKVLNGSALVPQSAIASCTATQVGKETYVPQTGHTDESYTIEEWYSDITQSETYTGMKVVSAQISLPSTGLATINFSFQGKDLAQTQTTQYFTSPTAAASTGVFAAVQGAVVVNGAPIALITSADVTIERAAENAVVVGSNSIADMFNGRIRANGNISVYYLDGTFRDYFANETTVSVVFALTTTSAKNSPALSIVLPKVKLGTHTKGDTETGIVAQHSFQALMNTDTSTGLLATTIAIQDTTL